MFKLDFIGVGPQRTASSWLDQVMRHHPDICLPGNVKETMFWDQRYSKGLPWYRAHFKKYDPTLKYGEIAPTYFDDSRALGRLQTEFPDLKIVINVRNPIQRAFSLYQLHLGKGRVERPFKHAVEQLPRILTSGHYHIHCPEWEAAFGNENILYLVQEDIFSQPDASVRKVWEFLGVSDIPLPEMAKQKFGVAQYPKFRNAAKFASKLSTWLRSKRLHIVPELGKKLGLLSVYQGGVMTETLDESLFIELREVFAADISWLEKKLDRDFSSWALSPECRDVQQQPKQP